MSELPTSLIISRDELNVPPIDLNNPLVGCTLVRGGLQLGGRTWRRQTTTSPFTNARTMVARTVDVDTRDITVRCRQATVGGIVFSPQRSMRTLAEAFSQFSYTLTLTLNGTVYAWLCETADWTVGQGGTVDDFQLMANQHEITFHVPVVRVLANPTNSTDLGWM